MLARYRYVRIHGGGCRRRRERYGCRLGIRGGPERYATMIRVRLSAMTWNEDDYLSAKDCGTERGCVDVESNYVVKTTGGLTRRLGIRADMIFPLLRPEHILCRGAQRMQGFHNLDYKRLFVYI